MSLLANNALVGTNIDTKDERLARRRRPSIRVRRLQQLAIQP